MMADDVVEGVETFFFILQTKKSACVTLGQIMFCEQAAAVRGEPQQAQLIGQSGGGAAQQGSGFLLRGAGLTEIGGDGGGFLQVMQVPALDIFDEGQNGGVLLIDLHFQTRNCLQSRQLGCPEAALSRYQLPAVIPAADGQGLDDPMAADGFRQLRQRSGSEFPSGLVWVGSDLLHRKPTDLRVQHARHLLTGSETAGVPGSACIVAPGSGGNVGKSVGKIKKARKIPRFFANRLL